MFYVGLDVHSKSIVGCVLDDEGKIYRRWTVKNIDQAVLLLKSLPSPRRVCFEASTGYGLIFERLSEAADHVVVAHPGMLKLIFRASNKTDRKDAERLAKLLLVDQVPTVHVPSAEVRAWRELITFRRKLVEKRTRAKNGIRGLLRSLSIVAPPRGSMWTKRGLACLARWKFDNAMHALRRDVLVEEIVALNDRIARVEAELARYADHSPAVALLQTIPGVGPRTAEAAAAFIDDPHRFPDSKRLGSYFGLVPKQDQSGDVNRMGRITREGSATVRHLLTEAVWQASRRSPTIRAYLERVQRGEKARRKIAITATAHYLIRVMWAMLKKQTVWRESTAA